LQVLAGIPEQKRLEQAKNNAKRRINELQNKIDTGDFARKKKKPLLVDDELASILAEKRKIQHEFDKLQYEADLKNRTKSQKIVDWLFELWNLPRGLMATGEFSIVLIQNLIYTIAHPISSGRAIGNMVSHLFSEKRAEAFARKMESQKWYLDAKEDKLALTEPDFKQSVKEELFMSNWVSMIWDLAGRPLSKINKEAYEKWKRVNPSKAFERATVGYANTVRLQRYREGTHLLEMQGKTRESHSQDYKDLASIINTFTGRTSLGKAELASKILSIGLFSPKMWASIAKTTTPWVLYTIGDKFSYSGSNTKEERTGKREISVAQKMAVMDLIKTMGAVTGLVLLAASYLNNDDDDETSVELDPKSSDFMKLKIGQTRIDPWGGRQQMVVLQARLIANAMTSTSTGQTTELGTPFKTPTRLGLFGQMVSNKQSPTMRLLTTYLNKNTNKAGETVDKYGQPLDMSKEIEESLYPIYWGTISDIYKNNPAELGTLMTIYALFGGGVSVYEQKEPKENKSGVVKPISPIKPIKPVKPL